MYSFLLLHTADPPHSRNAVPGQLDTFTAHGTKNLEWNRTQQNGTNGTVIFVAEMKVGPISVYMRHCTGGTVTYGLYM